MSILAAQRWTSNAEMIADVAKLGYLEGLVLDCTYGMGTFWQVWCPDLLVGTDLDPAKSPDSAYGVDFTSTHFNDGAFESVVFDPPYKLNGTPDPNVDTRYGVHIPSRWQARHQLIRDGISECARITNHYVLLKCMDQVVSGKKRWQTIEFTNHAATVGLDLVDRFDFLVTPRPQPEGRRQVHAQQNYSTLLVFSKRKASRP